MKAGILGLPYSGKSTLWCFLTDTLEGPDPSQAGKLQLKTVKVQDSRLERLRDDYQPKKYTPASLELGDFPAVSRDDRDRAGIAQLLAPARPMEVLIVVLRAFESPSTGAADPLRDWEEVRSELLLSDLMIVEKRVEKLRVQVKKPTPTQQQDRIELELLERVGTHLEDAGDLVGFPFTEAERKQIMGFQFLSAKPKIVVLNRAEASSAREFVARVAEKSGFGAFDIAALNELEIQQLPPEEREAFQEELGVLPGMREKILAECYRAAGRISFFTAGDKEVRAWTIREGEVAVEAAGEIHSDISRGFIRAETVGFDHYVEFGSIKGARENGHFRIEGKGYVVQDGDIIEFRFNV